MTVQEAILEHREEILRIAARHGATNVRVFGSVARGTAGPESDLDLLVDVGPNTSPWFPASLMVDLEDLLGVTVDVATEQTLHRVIRDRVMAEARPLSRA
jgi:predicted nucleotidyltransferase